MPTAYGGRLVAGCVGAIVKSWWTTTGPLKCATSASPRIVSGLLGRSERTTCTNVLGICPDARNEQECDRYSFHEPFQASLPSPASLGHQA